MPLISEMHSSLGCNTAAVSAEQQRKAKRARQLGRSALGETLLLRVSRCCHPMLGNRSSSSKGGRSSTHHPSHPLSQRVLPPSLFHLGAQMWALTLQPEPCISQDEGFPGKLFMCGLSTQKGSLWSFIPLTSCKTEITKPTSMISPSNRRVKKE